MRRRTYQNSVVSARLGISVSSQPVSPISNSKSEFHIVIGRLPLAFLFKRKAKDNKTETQANLICDSKAFKVHIQEHSVLKL